MNARSVPILSSSPLPIAAAAVLSALLVGVLSVSHAPLAIGVTIAICYVPVVFLNLPIGIVLWVGIIFVESVPAVSFGPFAIGVLLAAAWLGTFAQRSGTTRAVLANAGRLPLMLGLFAAWLALSLAYAKSSSMAAGDFWSWMVAIGSFILVATVIDRADRVRWIIVAFVSGAVLSVCLGLGSQLASGGLTGDAFSEGRLRGGGADPNYFAAGLVPALVLSAWLAGSTRRAEHRLMAVVAGLLLLIGLLSTQSRGGVVGLTAVVLASLVLGRGRRATIFAGLVTLVVAGAVYFTASPQSWHRVSNFGGDGTGRLDVWRVAWRVSGDYPFTGVGVGNFRLYSPKYVRRPGNINRVDIIVDRNVVVHNSYLSVLVETGIPGLILFLTVIGACLAAHWRAIRAFEQRNEWRLGGMGRALLVATIGLLAASFFISNGPDKRLWILLALGPVMLTIARRSHGGSVSRPGEQDEGATAAPLAPRPTRQTTAA